MLKRPAAAMPNISGNKEGKKEGKDAGKKEGKPEDKLKGKRSGKDITKAEKVAIMGIDVTSHVVPPADPSSES